MVWYIFVKILELQMNLDSQDNSGIIFVISIEKRML